MTCVYIPKMLASSVTKKQLIEIRIYTLIYQLSLFLGPGSTPRVSVTFSYFFVIVSSNLQQLFGCCLFFLSLTLVTYFIDPSFGVWLLILVIYFRFYVFGLRNILGSSWGSCVSWLVMLAWIACLKRHSSWKGFSHCNYYLLGDSLKLHTNLVT